jgi:hypothetical protein
LQYYFTNDATWELKCIRKDQTNLWQYHSPKGANITVLQFLLEKESQPPMINFLKQIENFKAMPQKVGTNKLNIIKHSTY